MGFSRLSRRTGLFTLSLLAALAAATLTTVGGCQMGPALATKKLARPQQFVDKDGLTAVEFLASLKVNVSPPADWTPLKTYHGALYTHKQWRSPTKATGVGVIYAHLPIPLPVSTLLWFAKQEYTKRSSDGKLLGQWTDNFGRSWFEAQNNKYHVRGYAVVDGTNAWFVYSGYRMTMKQRPDEIALAERCQETILIQPKPAAASGARADIRN
jgi:hypothetical protein